MSAATPLDRIAERWAGARVAYVSADPGIGVFGTKGASVHIQAVVRVLRAAGADVTVFAAKTDGPAPADLTDLPVYLLPTRAKGGDAADRERHLLRADDQIARIVADNGPFDLYYERYSLFSAAAAQAAANRGTPVVTEVNAPLIDEHTAQRGLAHPEEARATLVRLLSASDLAVCVSEPVRHWVLEHAPHTHARAVPNGADLHRITPGPGTPGATTIGFVGTLKPWHGVEVLLEAAAPVLRENPTTRLLIVGDGPLAGAIDERSARLGIAERIERTGAVDPARIPDLLHRMDIAVAPYPADADTYFSPLKVLEYLAAGLAVVASDIGQLPAMIDHERSGLLVPPSDALALRDALGRLIDRPELRRRLGRAARTQAEDRHGWEHTVARTLAGLPGGNPARASSQPREDAA